MNYSKQRFAKVLGLPIAVFSVSTAAILIRFSISHPIVIAFYRMVFSGLLFIPFFIKEIDEVRNISFNLFMLIAVSGLFLGLHFASWIYSLQFTTIASSVVLVSSHPLLVLFISDKFLNDKIGKKAYYSVLIALIGIFFIVLGDLQVQNWSVYGDILALVGMFFLAIYLVIGRKVRKEVSTGTYVFLVYFIASLLLGTLSLLVDTNLLVSSSDEYLIFFLLALIPTFFGHSVYNWALKYIKPDLVSLSLLGEPILSTLLAIIIFSEFPPLLSLLGFLITILGIYYSLKWR